MVTELLVPDQCWGNTGEWFLELKDGQRLRLSMELRSPMIDPDAQVDDISPQMLQWSNPFREGLRDFSNGSEWGAEGLETRSEHSWLSLVERKEEMGGKELKEPLLMAPLAVVGPMEPPTPLARETQGVTSQQPLDWSLQKHKA